VSTPHQLSRAQARRIAVSAQLLQAHRPTDLHEVVGGLALLQTDPTAAIAPSADLVAWSRLGAGYRPDTLQQALADHTLVELEGAVRLREDVALHQAEMRQWRTGEGEWKDWQVEMRGWVADNDACRVDILSRLEAEGPLVASELPDTCVRPWRSSGWNNNRNVDRMLAMMQARGEVAIAGREGRHRLYDLADRVYPEDPVLDPEASLRARNERRLTSLGLARATSASVPGEPNHVGDAGEPAVVEGVRGEWRVDPRYLDEPFEGRAALLSPFDRLVYDRKRMGELFEFEYYLEMYKPVAQRRWGYYALPILYGDRLVGKLDASADRKSGTFAVIDVHEDVPFTREMGAAVNDEIRGLATWLGLGLVLR